MRSLDLPRICELCGEKGEEIDHRVAISVARAQGQRAFARAFLVGNLRWLCRSCHRQKTAEERRKEVRPKEAPVKGLSDLPLFSGLEVE